MLSNSKPRLKPFIEFFSKPPDIYFFNRPHVATHLNDTSGFIFATCQLMDGSKNLTKLKTILSKTFPSEVVYLEKLLETMNNEYLIEDYSQNESNSLTKYEKIRWARNIEFFGAHSKIPCNKYIYQEKLKNAKITILGLGGIGSNVLLNLVAMGVKEITAIDYDKVELSNLNRQILYKESDVGKLKSWSAKKNISNFLINNSIQCLNKKISSLQDVESIIYKQDIIIGAIDQPREKTLEWINQACVNHNIPFICGGVDSHLAHCFSVIPRVTGCIECWKTTSSKTKLLFQKFIHKKEFVPAQSPNIAIMPLISISVGLITNEIFKIITGISHAYSSGKLCIFDFQSSQFKISEKWDLNLECPVCQKD